MMYLTSMERKNQSQLRQPGNPFGQTSKRASVSKPVTQEASMKSSYHCPSLMNVNNPNMENNMDQALPRSMSTMQNSVAYGNELINNEAYADTYTRTPNVELNKNPKKIISN